MSKHKHQIGRLKEENAKFRAERDGIRNVAKGMWIRIRDEYPNGGFPDMELIEDYLRSFGVIDE